MLENPPKKAGDKIPRRKPAPMKFPPGVFFLDSGAHTLYNKWAHLKHHSEKYKLYDSPEFWEYVDNYAAFVKRYQEGLDYYANVDVIHNPEKSWEVLKYLENKHGLRPVPVLHYGTPMKWVRRHAKEGYEYIGLGGVAKTGSKKQYMEWADEVFSYFCPPPKCLPRVRLHGFAITNFRLMTRYPWWSVDSASWIKASAYGNLFVPHKRNGSFTFRQQPYLISVAQDSPYLAKGVKSYNKCSPAERRVIEEWLENIEVPIGSWEPYQFGVRSEHAARKIANLKFFQQFAYSIPDWPWPFKISRTRGFMP